MGKKINIFLGTGIVVSMFGYYAFHHFVDQIDLPTLAAEEARTKYGLGLRIEKAAWTLWPAPGVTLTGLDLSEPSSQGAKASLPMAQAATLRGSLSWSALLSGRIEIDSIDLFDGRFILDMDATGASPWSRLAARINDKPESQTLANEATNNTWMLGSIHARNIAAEIKRTKKQDISASIEDMKINAKPQVLSWKSRVKVMNESMAIDGTMIPAGEGFEFKTSIDSKAIQATIDGRARSAERFTAKAIIQSGDASALGRLIHSHGLWGKAQASMNIERAASVWRIDDIDAQAMGWSAKGSATLPEPQGKSAAIWGIKARISGPTSTVDASTKQNEKTERHQSKIMLPWSALDLPEMNIDLVASGLPGLASGTLSAHARMGAGRLDARNLSWSSQAASFDGKAAANSKDRSVDLSGTFSGLSLEALAANSTIKGGSLAGSVSVGSRGDSSDDLIANLSGNFQARSGPASVASGSAGALGALMGAQFPWANKAGSYMQLDCAAMSARIERGVATGSPIMGFDGPALGAVGSGSVDLKSKTLDIGIDVRPKSGFDIANLSSFASALRITGSMASPSVSVDPSKTGKGLAAVGAAASTGGLSLIVGALAKRSESQNAPNPCNLSATSSARENANANTPAQPQPNAPKPSAPIDAIKGLFGFGKK